MGFKLLTGFIEHLLLITTNSYNALYNQHTLKTTVAHYYAIYYVLTSHCLVVVSNGVT
jgi:hypothetical protein